MKYVKVNAVELKEELGLQGFDLGKPMRTYFQGSDLIVEQLTVNNKMAVVTPSTKLKFRADDS